MKTFALLDIKDLADEDCPAYVIADSGLVTRGKPLFLPEWDSDFRALPAVALRVGKLGKTIAPRFAARYIDGVSPAVILRGQDTLTRLLKRGMPLTPALSFDGAAAVGSFAVNSLPDTPQDFTFRFSGHDILSFRQDIAPSAAKYLSRVSERNRLQTGDILLMPLTGETVSLSVGMDIGATMDCGGEVSELICRIR